MNNFIDIDTRVFDFINHIPHYAWLDKIALSLDYFGRDYVIYNGLICILLWALLFKKKDYLKPLLLLCAMLLFTDIIVHYLKDWIARPRPYMALNDVHLLGHASGGSLPSGHAARYGLIGLFMIFFVKRYKAFCIALIISGGLSRVYQGAHYPGDVLAAWIIVIFIMGLFGLLYNRLKKEKAVK